MLLKWKSLSVIHPQHCKEIFLLQGNFQKIISRFESSSPAAHTSLYNLHTAHKGKMVNFGGFQLPVQYGNDGIAASHRHTRAHCSLFDVSHMLQTEITGKDSISFFETLCTTDIEGLPEDRGALSLFTSPSGGILDDLMEKFRSEGKDVSITFREPTERALLAIQGPEAQKALQQFVDFDLGTLYFMRTRVSKISGIEGCRVTRCGYTGEDGFEISVPANASIAIAHDLLQSPTIPVHLAGLGARDTLRLEAGLCLYGNDIDENTTPVSAGLTWTIGKRRRQTKDFPGADKILDEIKNKPQKVRVGLLSEGRGPPARHGATIVLNNTTVGTVTSGCPSPSLGSNIAMGYVNSDLSSPGTKLQVKIRDTLLNVVVSKLPFVESKYYIPKKSKK
uniref:Aminomethyltransferase, mitochondrial n=1 Tax=Clastoptera arizonana TaxID=38151 RepID=A0A1B6E951_9HEMI